MVCWPAPSSRLSKKLSQRNKVGNDGIAHLCPLDLCVHVYTTHMHNPTCQRGRKLSNLQVNTGLFLFGWFFVLGDCFYYCYCILFLLVFFLVSFVCFYLCFNTGSCCVCSLGWPGTFWVIQARLRLTCKSSCLCHPRTGLQICATMCSNFYFLQREQHSEFLCLCSQLCWFST